MNDQHGYRLILPFDELSSSVHEAGTVDETVEAVATFALQALGATSAAILLGKHPERLQIATSTDAAIARIAETCDTCGPIQTAFDASTAVTVADLTTETAWPDCEPLAAAGAESGLRSLLAVRLLIGTRPAGVVLAGHPESGMFGEDEISIAYIVARHASIAVTRARHEETLVEAVDARKLVGQAMGILMERYNLDADRAFDVLARYSQHTNTKLRTVALGLIETRTLPGIVLDQPQAASVTVNDHDGQRTASTAVCSTVET
ncbi:GAF and ANTAR domain-containing protein [Microlunatus speluncae]|uniref:GAF and ANTAR domain-containing protein n=1 Tax=Microlunatus speluncae TaxID=2594267 RepID=UPI0012660FA0|nr:GAF and ANTAR domain-containing protein [Microlunatus speluncae]